MAVDLHGGYRQTASPGPPDRIRDARNVIALLSRVRDTDEARLLLDALGLLHAARTARALLKLRQRHGGATRPPQSATGRPE
ncbi:hypothetical protein [Pseudonocardia acaciae]|uniref:hypothetical protein n=1 Tax=Pseudonocardia acaciae TaxID=551276 RepID=UPI0012EE9EDB|nr:hypothetical protein [Pseudonocardia acaciae]